jgi:cytochrome c oxidase cbb3-type subunit 3
MFRIPALAIAALLTGSVQAQNPHPVNPEGQRLFVENCSACHGADAKGGRAPNLTSGKWQHGSTAPEIARNIHDGIGGTGMPPFPLPGNQPRVIADWLLSVTRGSDEAATGDAAAGRGVFFGSAGCSGCHAVSGAGHGFAPDLSGIGEQRSAADLTRAILQPRENPSGGNTGAEVRAYDGKTIRGLVVMENSFSLYLRERDEQLHLLAKSDIRDRKDLKTLMPKIALTAKQVTDLVAFLKQPEGVEPDLSTWQPASDFNVTWDRLKNSAAEPQNWLHYWGDLQGNHFSGLKSVTPANVSKLAAQWFERRGHPTGGRWPDVRHRPAR